MRSNNLGTFTIGPMALTLPPGITIHVSTVITPGVSDGCNSFDIVCLCVCVCLLPLSRPNGQTYGSEFQHLGQVEGYLGQV